MMHEIYKQDKYIVVTNGLGLTCGPIHNGDFQVTTTGQPIMVAVDTKQAAIDMYYSKYEEQFVADAPGEMRIIATPHRIMWDIGYSQEEANQICSITTQIIDGLFVKPIRHPLKGDWATPVFEHLFNVLQASPDKDILTQKYQTAIKDTRRKTIQEMTTQNWVNNCMVKF